MQYESLVSAALRDESYPAARAAVLSLPRDSRPVHQLLRHWLLFPHSTVDNNKQTEFVAFSEAALAVLWSCIEEMDVLDLLVKQKQGDADVYDCMMFDLMLTAARFSADVGQRYLPFVKEQVLFPGEDDDDEEEWFNLADLEKDESEVKPKKKKMQFSEERDRGCIWWTSEESKKISEKILNRVKARLDEKSESKEVASSHSRKSFQFGSAEFWSAFFEKLTNSKQAYKDVCIRVPINSKTDEFRAREVLNVYGYEVSFVVSEIMLGRKWSSHLSDVGAAVGSALPTILFVMNCTKTNQKLLGLSMLESLIRICCSNYSLLEFHLPIILKSFTDQLRFRDLELVYVYCHLNSLFVSGLQNESGKYSDLVLDAFAELINCYSKELLTVVTGTGKDRFLCTFYAKMLSAIFLHIKHEKIKFALARNLKNIISLILYVLSIHNHLSTKPMLMLLRAILVACPERYQKHARKIFLALSQVYIRITSSDEESNEAKSLLITVLKESLQVESIRKLYFEFFNDLADIKYMPELRELVMQTDK
jgi:hypothetical protein